MFDITTAQQVDYSEDGISYQATIFQDREDKGLWYLVPIPRLVYDDGNPAFSLTKYLRNGGGIAGFCSFDVELYDPPAAKRAAEQKYPDIKQWGQFTWVSGDATFEYATGDAQGSASRQILVTPSLFATNRARFLVDIKDAAVLNAFVEAFNGDEGGGASSFAVLYDMGVLTQLLGASATIKYIASAAIEYERKYETRKDIWGNREQVLVEISQKLNASGAGDVAVKEGPGGSPELVQRVRDWAWTTLEYQVADAIETARGLANGNTNPIQVINDFNATYAEDTIMEWSTPVSRLLPRFGKDLWAKVYHEVDDRQLIVAFDILGDPTGEDGAPKITQVTVTVDYPTRTTGNTFTLTLEKSVEYVAPGYISPQTGQFDPNFKYKYEVFYTDGAPSYTSGWIASSETRVSLLPSQLGLRKVQFIGSDIPFSKAKDGLQVQRIFIDFYETPPEGQEAKLQTKEMLGNGIERAVTFQTTYSVPITNSYNYRLRYILVSGDIITVQPNVQFGSPNADVVRVTSPAPETVSFSLRALQPAGASFLSIDASAAYFDAQNATPATPPTHMWQNWEPENALSSSTPWQFPARPDVQTAYFELNGQLIYEDADVFTMTNLRVPYSHGPLILKATEEVYSVEIFPEQIDWSQVAQVTLNLFQEKAPNGDTLAEVVEITPARLTELVGEDPVAPTGLIPYNILPPADGASVKSLPLYYVINKPRAAGNIVFYYNGTYVMRDGTRRDIGPITVTNRLQLHLPPVGQEAAREGIVHAVGVEMALEVA